VPDHIIPPSQDELSWLRVKPADNETEDETKKSNHAITYLVEHILPGVRGSKNWKETISSTHLIDTGATPSDIAFGILVYENMREKWDKGDDASKSERGKYTSSGSNRKFSGWSRAGISRYNRHFTYAVRNQDMEEAMDVEEEVMKSLKDRLFKRASLEMIRKSKTRKKKRRISQITEGEDDDEDDEELPLPMWSVDQVEEV